MRFLWMGLCFVWVLLSCAAQPSRIETPPVPAVADAAVETSAPVDTDGDGVVGEQDHCPDAAEDCDGVDDTDGCPDLDNDQDGVVDVCDQCPNDWGPPPNGCRGELLIQPSEIRIIPRVMFARNSVQIPPAGEAEIELMARVLQQHRDLLRIAVRGHTAANERRPRQLSQERAQRVLERLVAYGVDRSRLVIESYGAERPSVREHTEADRARNRRVEFELLERVTPPRPPPHPPRRPVPEGCPDHPPTVAPRSCVQENTQ